MVKEDQTVVLPVVWKSCFGRLTKLIITIVVLSTMFYLEKEEIRGGRDR